MKVYRNEAGSWEKTSKGSLVIRLSDPFYGCNQYLTVDDEHPHQVTVIWFGEGGIQLSQGWKLTSLESSGYTVPIEGAD